MSINKKSNRIDLDAGDILYHMKVSALGARDFREASEKKTNVVAS